jgi:hypothetical protein
MNPEGISSPGFTADLHYEAGPSLTALIDFLVKASETVQLMTTAILTDNSLHLLFKA